MILNKIQSIPPEIKLIIKSRIKEFKDNKNLFSELCFCLLTANFQAQRCIEIQNKLKDKFIFLTEQQLAGELKSAGHRFPNTRAKYIYEARQHQKLICSLPQNGKQAREILVKNIKGLGMKEASHFLRNIGYKDVAIIDFHILDLLEKQGLIKKPKTITPKKYLEIEKILENLANQANLNLAELDLCLWYLETGKVLK